MTNQELLDALNKLHQPAGPRDPEAHDHACIELDANGPAHE